MQFGKKMYDIFPISYSLIGGPSTQLELSRILWIDFEPENPAEGANEQNEDNPLASFGSLVARREVRPRMTTRHPHG